MAHYGISETANISNSPGVDLGVGKKYELRRNDEFLQYRNAVGNQMWFSVMARPGIIVNALSACARHSKNQARDTGKYLYKLLRE